MSYARVPRRGLTGFYGYAGYSDLPPADPNSIPGVASYKAQAAAAVSGMADQSKAQAIAYASQQLQNYPSAAEVLAQYNEYSGYLKSVAGFDPADMQDPKKCVALMKQALIAYAKANGYPTSTKEAEQALVSYAASVAASELGVSIPANWPTNLKDLKSVAVDLACTAVVMETGVDPRSLTVVADALADGKLSEDECTAIGTAAGAIAGAVIGQAFGIPAPIGAFVGGLIGGDIGGTIGEIFGATNHPTEQEMIDAAKAWINATLTQANTACTTTRSDYWKLFDQMLLAVELQWEVAEASQVGWRFDLRWFGAETYSKLGMGFSHLWNPPTNNFTGGPTSAWRAQVIKSTPTDTYANDPTTGQAVTIHGMEYDYGCPVAFGCPYPVVTGVPMPGPPLNRVAQAFLARGAEWLPPAQRHPCSFPQPPVAVAWDGGARSIWIQSMQAVLAEEQQAVKALRILSVTVAGDLIKTAAVVGAEKGLYDLLKKSTLQLNTNAIQRGSALAQAKITGQNLSDMLNYGMLALGVGLLGAALWKRKRRSS